MLIDIVIEIAQVFVCCIIVDEIEHQMLDVDDYDEFDVKFERNENVSNDEIDEVLLKHQLDVQIVFELDEVVLLENDEIDSVCERDDDDDIVLREVLEID